MIPEDRHDDTGAQSQLRQDKLTKRWVVIAPARGKRPSDFRRKGLMSECLPAREPSCPFCPGNESSLTEILLETRDASGWQTRVVTNKYPALTPVSLPNAVMAGFYASKAGHGRHEVIIETPLHNRPLALMDDQEIEAVVGTYLRRYSDLIAMDSVMTAMLFRNHGERAGTSLIHPHSQIIALGIVPRHLREMEREFVGYFDEWGRCLVCDMIEHELDSGVRLVAHNDHFVCVVPFAAASPFEMTILPRRHTPDFGLLRQAELPALARILRDCLAALHHGLGDPDLNFVLQSSVPPKTGTKQFHWQLAIRPRLTTPAGFEIGTGININPSAPENDARFLREQLANLSKPLDPAQDRTRCQGT